MPGLNNAADGGFSTMMLMNSLIIMGCLVIATALYLLHPRCFRERVISNKKKLMVISIIDKGLSHLQGPVPKKEYV